MDLSPAADPSPAFPVALPPHAHLAPDGRVHLRADVEIREVREEGGYALAEGIAYPALVVADGGKVAGADSFRIDTYKTWMSPETLRTFAHRFLERGTGGIDSQHDHGNVGLIVESWYQREATDRYPTNVWVVVVKVLKADAIEGLRAKTLRGFSIEFVGKYRDAPLEVEGIGKVRTAEIVDPYPLTLSLVGKPATRLPFAEIEQRAEGETATEATAPTVASAARAESDADEGHGRAVLVRFDPPAEGTGDTMPTKTAAGAARTEAAPADPTPAAVRVEGTTPAAPAVAPAPEGTGAAPVVAATPAVAEPAAPAARTEAPAPTLADLRPEFRALVERALGEPTTSARAEGSVAKRSCDWSDLASVLAEYDAKWTFNDAVWRYLYAAQSVFYECGYCAEDDAQVATMVRKMAADLMAAINGACDELEASAMARSARSAIDATTATVAARAGKTLSAKNRKRVAGAHDAADSCRSMLKELLDETGESEDEGEGQACSERAAPAQVAPADDVIAALRAEHAAEVAKLRAELDAKGVDLAAVTKRADETTGALAAAEKRVATLHDEKAAAEKRATDLDAARTAAEKRVADLEGARPAPKGTGNGATPPAASAARKEELPFASILYSRAEDPTG